MVGSRRRAPVLAGVLAAAGILGILVTSGPEGALTPQILPPSPEAAARPVPSAPVPDRGAAVSALLARRADAIRRRDLGEFLADIDPDSDPRFRAGQRAMFDNLGPLPDATASPMPSPPVPAPTGNPSPAAAATPAPFSAGDDSPPATAPPSVPASGVAFSDWTYLLDPQAVVPAPAPASLPHAPDESWAPQVTLRYALAGADDVPTSRPMGYLFARRGDRWYLTSDDQLGDEGRSTWRGPWDYAPCQGRRVADGVVISHPGQEASADRLARRLDSAVSSVTAVWGPGWPRRVAILQPSTLPELRAVVGSRFATDGIAAVAVADRIDRATRTVEGARVVFNPDTTAKLTDAELRVVLRHEVTHVAARASTVDGSSMWMLEGFAEYVGYRDSGLSIAEAAPNLVPSLRSDGPPGDLPSTTDFQTSGARLDLVYQEAWSAASYVVQTSGEAKLVELYRRIAGAGPLTDDGEDAAFRAVLGISRAEFVHGWQDYLRRTF